MSTGTTEREEGDAAPMGSERHMRADAVRNRERILEAATTLMAIHGIDVPIDRIADQRREQRPRGGLVDCVELAVLQILDPGREPVAQQMAEAKHVIRRAGGVGVVLDDAQIGLVGMMVQAVEHVRRFAHRRRNDPRVERSVMAGHVRIEHRARVDAVFGVNGAARSGAAVTPPAAVDVDLTVHHEAIS